MPEEALAISALKQLNQTQETRSLLQLSRPKLVTTLSAEGKDPFDSCYSCFRTLTNRLWRAVHTCAISQPAVGAPAGDLFQALTTALTRGIGSDSLFASNSAQPECNRHLKTSNPSHDFPERARCQILPFLVSIGGEGNERFIFIRFRFIRTIPIHIVAFCSLNR